MKTDNEVVINPMFYDALSETFRPPTDELKRDHTLGRLAVATLTKGERIQNSAIEESSGLVTFRYTPSWAEMVQSEVTCEISSDGSAPQLSTMRLSSGEHSLDIVDLSFCETPQVEISEDDLEELDRMPIVLGHELVVARFAIACVAQKFFDRLAS